MEPCPEGRTASYYRQEVLPNLVKAAVLTAILSEIVPVHGRSRLAKRVPR